MSLEGAAKAKIQSAYDSIAKPYDDMMTLRSIWSRLLVRLVWGFSDTAYSEKVLAWLPDDFSGALLDIPAGTCALTTEKHLSLKSAKITCADYSEGMLAIAKERCSRRGVRSAAFLQADAGALPFEDQCFDAVLTMNGLHVFPDKNAALREMTRVLKPGAFLAGCCYVKGERKRTDWIATNWFAKRGYLSPPFWTMRELESLLRGLFGEVETWSVGSIAGFRCQR